MNLEEFPSCKAHGLDYQIILVYVLLGYPPPPEIDGNHLSHFYRLLVSLFHIT
jgi:hypothetical protein